LKYDITFCLLYYRFNESPNAQWFSPGTPVFSTNKTDRNDISEILLKVALNTINKTKPNTQCAKPGRTFVGPFDFNKTKQHLIVQF